MDKENDDFGLDFEIEYDPFDLQEVGMMLEYWRDYLKTSEEWLKFGHDIELKRIENEHNIKELPPNSKEYDVAVSEFYLDSDLREHAFQHFMRTLHYSFVTSLYTILESYLISFCKEQKKKKKIPQSVDELTGGSLERIKHFFKLAGVELPKNWEHAHNILKIRNCIVHAGGRIDETESDEQRKKLRNLISKIDGFSIVASNSVYSIYGEDMIELNGKFFEWSFRQVETICREIFKQR